MAAPNARPPASNIDLVNHALEIIKPRLQDFVIRSMEGTFGSRWWDDCVVARKLVLNASNYLPTGDASEAAIRSYMDITLCMNIISQYKLVKDSSVRSANNPLQAVRRVRNFQSHNGRTDITDSEAAGMVMQVIALDEYMSLGCADGLWEIMRYLGPAGVQVNPPVEWKDVTTTKTAGKEGSAPAHVPSENGSQAVEVRVVGETGSRNDDRTSVSAMCIDTCESFRRRLEEKQKGNGSVGRSTSEIKSITPSNGVYHLSLYHPIIPDDSMGITIGGYTFESDRVRFENYKKATQTIDLITEDPDLRRLLDSNDPGLKKILFTDMLWIVNRTRDFYSSFSYHLDNPSICGAPSEPLGKTYLNLSDEQRKAVEMSMSEPLSYVWGVPGSGKTQYVLATTIIECIRKGQRVAVVAPTNSALEQVLRGLLHSFEGIPEEERIINPREDVVRIGTPTSEFMDNYGYVCYRKDMVKKMDDLFNELLELRDILSERRYDEYRSLCESSLAKASSLGQHDIQGRKAVVSALKPLIDLVNGDMRLRHENISVFEDTLKRDIQALYDTLYQNRDRSAYLKSKFPSMSVQSLEKEVADREKRFDAMRRQGGVATPETAKVVAMTLPRFIISYGPSAADGRIPLDVDHVFVDEAGYCNCIQTYTLYSLGVPITFLGDHMQLEPVCEIESKLLKADCLSGGQGGHDFLWDMSSLHSEHLMDGDMDKLSRTYLFEDEPDFAHTAYSPLTTTHRFGSNLAEALGRYVYTKDGIISASDRPLEVKIISAYVDKFNEKQDRFRRPNSDEEQAKKYYRTNSAEAKEVFGYIRENLSKSDDYVVLTPYMDQRKYLQEAIPRDRVLTIHSSQGREWDTVIISLVDCRANENQGVLMRFTSILPIPGEEIKGLKVMNTALSRAKRRLVLVCDAEFWASRNGEHVGDVVRSNYP